MTKSIVIYWFLFMGLHLEFGIQHVLSNCSSLCLGRLGRLGRLFRNFFRKGEEDSIERVGEKLPEVTPNTP